MVVSVWDISLKTCGRTVPAGFVLAVPPTGVPGTDALPSAEPVASATVLADGTLFHAARPDGIGTHREI